MPELPEVETVARGLALRLEGRVLARVDQHRPDLRFPLPDRFAQRLVGRRVAAIGRRAKYLVIRLDDGMVVLGHLGMSGRMVITEVRPPPPPGTDPALAKHDHLVWWTADGARVAFNDPRRFGSFDLVSDNHLGSHPALKDLGPEPLSDAFGPEHLTAAFAGRRAPVKALLLDQRLVAGLGNIYVCEALFAAGISPLRPAGAVDRAAAGRLAAAIKAVLEKAIAAGGSSLRDYVQADGALGYFQHAWAVYGREGQACPHCVDDRAGACGIRRIVQSNRSSFYCPKHQT